MNKAFVFGKFLPFHNGHKAMIDFAKSHCDFLTVLICCSDQELIDGKTRKSWMEETFIGNPKIEFQILDYKESELPNTSESSKEISFLWSKKFKEILPEHSLLITSEPYGEFVAEFMGIKHIPFDYSKTKRLTSSTAIRNDLRGNWKFLPESVKKHFAKKVVVLGTESSGKTFLTEQLAKHFHCPFVPEAAREVIPSSKQFTLDDLYAVAKQHAEGIEKVIHQNFPLVIIDTNILTTQSYSNYFFKHELKLEEKIILLNKADLYLYLKNDIDFVQDGTRLDEEMRNQMDISHRNTLLKNNISFHEISGDKNERFEKSVSLIEQLFSGIVWRK